MSDIVNGLWIGTLGRMQVLSIRSFLKRGHKYKLWVYDKHMKNIPKGVEICDANSILDKRYIFKHWSGNLATFADIFRYKLLYEKGGWWVDMDLVCLKRLPKVKYFFGGERTKQSGAFKSKSKHTFWIGLMKFPRGDPILKQMYDDMMSKREDFQNPDKNLQFSYGQTRLKKLLQAEYGMNFVYTHNKYDVDLFNPLSYFDMIDFFTKGDIKKCCNRWGWSEMDVDTLLKRSYTVHLFNKVIKELEGKRGMKCKLIEKLEKMI